MDLLSRLERVLLPAGDPQLQTQDVSLPLPFFLPSNPTTDSPSSPQRIRPLPGLFNPQPPRIRIIRIIHPPPHLLSAPPRTIRRPQRRARTTSIPRRYRIQRSCLYPQLHRPPSDVLVLSALGKGWTRSECVEVPKACGRDDGD
jgi:hypothetical protein